MFIERCHGNDYFYWWYNRKNTCNGSVIKSIAWLNFRVVARREVLRQFVSRCHCEGAKRPRQSPGRVEIYGVYVFTLVVGYFADAQYDVKSPIGALRHFACAADAPLLSLSRHFPRFSGGIYPEGGSETTRHSERSEESHRRTDGHILFTLVVGYFANAQYDVRSPIGGRAADRG